MTVTTPQGFRAAGVTAGLKPSGKPDLALVVNDGPDHVAAAVFTTNRVVGHPVTWSRQAVSDGVAHAVVLNSGGANVCTGPDGFLDTHRTAEAVAAGLDISAADVLVASTGLIGERLPIETLLAGITPLVAGLSADGGPRAAEAIMTTDTVPKQAAVERSGWSVGGMAKGAGMLAPALATMLVVAHHRRRRRRRHRRRRAAGRDAAHLRPRRLRRRDVDLRHRRAARLRRLRDDRRRRRSSPRPSPPSAPTSPASCVADAEGASHDVAVEVVGAETEDAAVAVARAVTRSALVKTAIFGNDPNWGRILAQVGTVPIEVAAFDADAVDVSINGVMVCKGGGAHAPRTDVDLASRREVEILIDLHAGPAAATVWTNDLTHDYVHENSAYST